jgi:hypothetical protein
MAKLSVSKITIQTAGDGGAIVTAGASSHTFENGLDALDFARDALGYPAPAPAYDPIKAILDQMARVKLHQMTEAAREKTSGGTTNVDIVNAALKKMGEKSPLTPAGIAEAKRLEKNRKQRERAAKKRKAAKRKK